MKKLTVFYDGKCHLCFREIKHYHKLDSNKDNNKLLRLIDISASNFNPAMWGLSNMPIEVSIHAIDESGIIYSGVDTFAEIWKRISPYNKLAFILESKKLRPLFNIGYKIFATQIRPRLPKRKCENQSCEILL